MAQSFYGTQIASLYVMVLAFLNKYIQIEENYEMRMHALISWSEFMGGIKS